MKYEAYKVSTRNNNHLVNCTYFTA